MNTSHTVHIRTAAVALLLLLPVLHGCQGKELSVASQTFSATTRYLDAQYDAGNIKPETQVNVIMPARKAAKAILDEAVDAYLNDKPYDWRASLSRFYQAMTPLLRQRELLEPNKP